MTIDLWISIALAIPLAIAANLFTPYARSWLDQRAERGATVKKQRSIKSKRFLLESLTDELKVIESYVNDSSKYQGFLLEILIRAALYGALGTMYAGMLFASYAFMEAFRRQMSIPSEIAFIISAAGQVIPAVTSLLVFTICWRGLRVIRRVRNFVEWKAVTATKMSELQKQIETSSSSTIQ